MKKKITPIAMKCNKEQFEAIKPKLKGMEIHSVTCFNDYPYLINYDNGIKLSNIDKYTFKNKIIHAEEIHEIWNERIFLVACGIETQETFEITKETIIKYKMKDEFPEVFKVKLEVGKWYKTKSNCLFNLNKITDEFYLGYGFTKSMTYYSVFKEYIRTELKEATEKEVFEALKNEAVKRGFKEGVCVQDVYNGKTEKCTTSISSNNFDYEKIGAGINSGKMALRDSDGSIIFFNGKWATIIPTKTKEEAEKLLGVKIV